MNYQNPAYIRNVLYNYNQRLDKIEQNISRLFSAFANNKITENEQPENSQQETVNGLVIPKFRFITTGYGNDFGYLLEFITPNLNYSDFNNLPTGVTKDNFNCKVVGSSNYRFIVYILDTDTEVYPHGPGFYAYYFPIYEPQGDVDTTPKFIGKTLYECGLSSDPNAKIVMDKATLMSQTFDLTYNGKPVYITNEEVRDISYYDIFSGGKIVKVGYKLSTQICGCDYAIALTTPTTPA